MLVLALLPVLCVGSNSERVVIGSATKTAQVAGSLVANAASVTGALSAAGLTTGDVTVNNVWRHTLASGSSQLVGTLHWVPMLVHHRPPRALHCIQRSHHLVIGQAAGVATSAGGDLVLNAGTGVSSGTCARRSPRTPY